MGIDCALGAVFGDLRNIWREVKLLLVALGGSALGMGGGGEGGGEYEWFVVVRIEACVGLELAGCGLNVNST